jgi:hypothetical protein
MVTNYPWQKLKPGEGFFVPTLDLQKEKERGLTAALRVITNAKAVYGIKDGVIGVWFYRPATQSSKTAA